MNSYEQSLFSNLLDVNWMIEENKSNKDLVKYLEIAYHKIQDDLRESMGDKEYREYIRMGREMFAPAKG
jgi:hypothetical protein